VEDHLCFTSLDTVALAAVADPLDEFGSLVELLGGLPSQIRLPSYLYNYRLSDGTRVSWGYLGASPGRVYIYLSPSKTRFALLSQLLRALSSVGVQRCDIAIDYLGRDIQNYELHCPRLGLAYYKLSREAYPRSVSFGEGSSHRRLAGYNKLEKCRVDHIREMRIVDVHGLVHQIPVWRYLEDEVGWMRLEARVKGHWILDRAIPRPGVFDDLIGVAPLLLTPHIQTATAV